MADFNEQVNRLWDRWIEETEQQSGDPGEFVDWAMDARLLAPYLQDIKRVMRKKVTQVLRQAKRYDEEGRFTYRAKQSVTLFENGIATNHFFDTDKGGSQTMRQKSIKQRRDAAAHFVYRGVCDAERMSKMFPDEPQLNFWPDFHDDVAELRAAELAERDEGEEAA